MSTTAITYPHLGFGLGLRPEYYQQIIDSRPALDWFEILSEDYLVEGGRHLYYLTEIAKHYPLVMHGVSMSIGSTDPLNFDYLSKLKNLAERFAVKWISDHLCWTGVAGINTHDLLPLPYTDEVLLHVISRIKEVQEFLERRILIENPSSYVSFQDSIYSEAEFIAEMASRADCLLLLDVNNIYVSAHNHGFDPYDYINSIPTKRVQQIHLAGHSHKGNIIVDTHSTAVIEEVWQLYKYAIKRFGLVSTMIERDDEMPEFSELLEEIAKAKQIADNVARQPAL